MVFYLINDQGQDHAVPNSSFTDPRASLRGPAISEHLQRVSLFASQGWSSLQVSPAPPFCLADCEMELAEMQAQS